MPATPQANVRAGLDLFWLPLGAGGHSVRWNGRIYEMICSHLERRDARDLYHSALRITLPSTTYVVEMTPAWKVAPTARGVLTVGAVGAHWAGRSRLFRYEVHCWQDGTIADLDQAVDSPVRLNSDEATCQALLDHLASVPAPVWGRDELHTGEMWNSNSVTSWALERSGFDAQAIQPPGAAEPPGGTQASM